VGNRKYSQPHSRIKNQTYNSTLNSKPIPMLAKCVKQKFTPLLVILLICVFLVRAFLRVTEYSGPERNMEFIGMRKDESPDGQRRRDRHESEARQKPHIVNDSTKSIWCTWHRGSQLRDGEQSRHRDNKYSNVKRVATNYAHGSKHEH